MKIAFFHAMTLNHGGGCENNFVRMSAKMASFKHKVTILSLRKKVIRIIIKILNIFYGTVFRKGKKSFHRLSNKEIRTRLSKAQWKETKLNEIKKELDNSDLIYTKNELVDLFLLKLINSKSMIVCGMHTPIFYPTANSFHEKIHNAIYKSFIYKWLIKQCDFFRVLNKDDKTLLHTRYKISLDKIFTIGNGVDTTKFTFKKIKNKKSKFKIIFVGRFCQQKGVDTLIETIHSINSGKSLGNFIEFTIIGDGALQEKLEQNIINYKNVTIINKVSPKNIHSLYLDHKICIAPSKWETFNSVILEAQSCGLPVVAFDIPGPKEMVINNKSGYLIKLGDDAEFIKKVKHLIELYKQRPLEFMKLQEQAHSNIKQTFSNQIIFKKLELMFKTIYK